MIDEDTGRIVMIHLDMMTGDILKLRLLRRPYTEQDIKDLETGLSLLIPIGLTCAVDVVTAVKASLLRAKLAAERKLQKIEGTHRNQE